MRFGAKMPGWCFAAAGEHDACSSYGPDPSAQIWPGHVCGPHASRWTDPRVQRLGHGQCCRMDQQRTQHFTRRSRRLRSTVSPKAAAAAAAGHFDAETRVFTGAEVGTEKFQDPKVELGWTKACGPIRRPKASPNFVLPLILRARLPLATPVKSAMAQPPLWWLPQRQPQNWA